MRLAGKIFIGTGMALFCLALLSFFEFTVSFPSGKMVRSDSFKGLSFLGIPFLFIGLVAEREDLKKRLEKYSYSLQTHLDWWGWGDWYARRKINKYRQKMLEAKEAVKDVYEKLGAIPENLRVKMYEAISVPLGKETKRIEGYHRSGEIYLSGADFKTETMAHEMVHAKVEEKLPEIGTKSLYFQPFTEAWAWCLEIAYRGGGINRIKGIEEENWADVKSKLTGYIAKDFEGFYRQFWREGLIKDGYDTQKAEEWSRRMVERSKEFSDLIMEIIRRKPASVIEKAMGTYPMTPENLRKWLYAES